MFLSSADSKSSLRTGKNKIIKKNNFRILIFFLILLWCSGFALNAIPFGSPESTIFTPVFKKFYSSFCHQFEERSFIYAGKSFFVCARCSGIYFGALLVSFISLFFFKKEYNLNIKYFIASLFPLFLDLILYTMNIYDYSKTIAFFTGIFSGSTAFIYILALFELHYAEKLST